MEPTDAELMRRWQQGDALAFEALVHRWQQPVGRLLARLTSFEQAADLAQEVFLRVYLAGRRYREEGAFTTWLYRILLNVARDAGRKNRRRPEMTGLDDSLPAAQESTDPVQQQEVVELVNRALTELPESLREVLVLHHYEGLKFEEIARLTGTPASTLKSRFAVALNRLRQRLQSLSQGPEENHP